MTTIYIYLDINKPRWYCSQCVYIKVSGPKEINFKGNQKTGFKCFKHTFWASSSCKLEFLIPDFKNEKCYKCLKISQTSNRDQCAIQIKNGYNQVYIYFYNSDPRPLLFCCDGTAYKPRGKDEYDTEWVKAPGVDKCDCTNEEENDKLIDALVGVVGFLNRVELQMHPNIKGNGCTISSGVSTVGAASTCNTNSAQDNSNTCTYPVHTYKGRDVKVKVTCKPVTRNGQTETSGGCNYKKLTHQPAGMCDASGQASTGDGDGYRLGNVTYPHGRGRTSAVQYYTENGDGNLSDHWRKPLVSVSAYFYNGDTKYQDPLLVVLEFNNGDSAGAKVCECYKLLQTISETDSMSWTKDPSASSQIGDGGDANVVKYLDGIRYKLKKVLQIKLECNDRQYQLKGRASGTGNNGFQKLQNGEEKKITVTDCESVCKKLKSSHYKCVVHKIKEALKDIHNQVAGVAFTIPGKKGEEDNPIEIELFNDTAEGPEGNCKPGKNGQIPLFYNKCMGDVYVFFYGTGGGSASPDNVPLMLWYAGNYYAPCNRDSYFTRWEQVNGLSGKPCHGEVNQLVTQLDNVNRALNIIELDKSSEARTGIGGNGYGLPKDGGVSRIKPSDSFPTKRIALTKQDGPKTPQPAYYRVVHRTVNGFTIGPITYNKEDIVNNGVKINGTGGGGGPVKISVKNGGLTNNNHTKLVAGKGWNTVVAYYSSSDNEFKLPQLIVILKTNDVGNPVTSVKGTGYGYYILTNNGANDYEYVWRSVTNGQSITLNDATDFLLLNSVVILLNQRPKNGGAGTSYNDGQIKEAITSSKLCSPGQEVGEINRITGGNITVSEGTVGTCLNTTGFKVFTHDISPLVTINGSLKGLSEVKLIAGLKFLIPTFIKDSYRRIKVLDNGTSGKTNGTELFLYHKPNGDENKKICVYFYQGTSVSTDGKEIQGDPRPLMLCYAESAYRPKDKKLYFKEWVKDTKISNCACKGDAGSCDELVKALVKVSDFLNPVKIKNVPIQSSKCKFYNIHWFNGNLIKIKVELTTPAKDGFCYNGYTHTHSGTGTDGKGFRLGNIEYNGKCIQLEGYSGTNGCISSQLVNEEPPTKYTAASKVVVFYYQGDNKFERPLLVALCDKDDPNTCNLYYELQKDASSSGAKLYNKVNSSINVNETSSGGTLDTTLGRILSDNNNQLQIIIDKIPMPTLYCPETKPEPTQNSGKKQEKHPFPCKPRENGQKSQTGPNGKKNPTDDVIPPSYQAQLYNSEGAPLPNGPGTPTTTTKTVKVTPVKCKQLANHGYKCYKHDLIGVQGIEQIGGLKFYLWDNTEGASGGGANCATSAGCPSVSSPGNPSNGKELCLYGPSSSPSSAGTQDSCPATAASPESGTSCTATDQTLTLITQFPYTTCKGNVYVYFYGDDPRPLLLCYDGKAYGPMCKEEYECRWVCLQDVTGCGVEVKEGGKMVCKGLDMVVRRYVLLVIFHTIFNLFVVFTKMIAQILPLH